MRSFFVARPHAHAVLAAALLSSMLTGTAYAQTVKASDLTPAHRLNSAAAAKIMAAAEQKAATAVPSAIVIVDTSGSPIMAQRMDGASPSTFKIALGKAATAAAFGRPTAALEDAANGGRTALVSAGFVVMQGGVPLTVGSEVVGAIGVSGGTKEQDEAAAKAGAAILGE